MLLSMNLYDLIKTNDFVHSSSTTSILRHVNSSTTVNGRRVVGKSYVGPDLSHLFGRARAFLVNLP